MDMHWTRRAMVGAALSAVAAPLAAQVATGQEKAAPKVAPAASTATTAAPSAPTAAASTAAKGKLTDQSLGNLLKAMGLQATAAEQRYDFAFKATIEDAEWELSMSAVLSQDGSSIWIMAWLDELPKSAADVPRTALLRLLSDNDKLGKGKFFAYIAANRRFVLQRVIPNENITAATFRAALDDLGQSVVGTHADWSVANWATSTAADPATAQKSGTQVKGSSPQATQAGPATTPVRPASQATGQAPATGSARPVQSAINDPKFNSTTKK